MHAKPKEAADLGEHTLKPIRLETAREQIKNALRDAILSNEFKRGDTLNVAELAGQLGVSAMPVREALSALERDGLVELRPRKTAVVLGADERYIRDYYRIRALLEGEAALQASARAEDEAADARAVLTSCAEPHTLDPVLFSFENDAFHQAIWEMSGNRRLQGMLKEIWMSKAITQSAYTTEDMQRSADAHREIARSILSHRGEEARDCMEKHLTDGMAIVLRQLF